MYYRKIAKKETYSVGLKVVERRMDSWFGRCSHSLYSAIKMQGEQYSENATYLWKSSRGNFPTKQALRVLRLLRPKFHYRLI